MNVPERPNIEQLKKLILTSEQFRDSPFAKSEKRTYSYALENNSKRILFFGSTHIYNPDNPMFAEIKKLFEEENPDMVYIEGWRAINDQPEKVREMMAVTTLPEAAKDGESHFTLKLATEAGVSFESPEPEDDSEIKRLLELGFSREEIFNFYAYRQLGQYQDQNPKNDRSLKQCAGYMRRYLDRFRNDSKWDHVELAEFEKKLFAGLDLDDEDKYHSLTDPIPWDEKEQTVFNDIARASSRYRDEHILARIMEGLQSHSRLFVVYGSAHAVTLEPALRALIEQQK